MENNQSVKDQQQGFALLMSLIVVSVLLSIGLTVLELATLQVQLSTNVRDSEAAFHAANAGMECGRNNRRTLAAEMESVDDNVSRFDLECFNKSPTLSPRTVIQPSLDADVYLYDYYYEWRSGTGFELCSEISTLVVVSYSDGFTVGDMANIVPGYPIGTDLVCNAGERCTVLSSRGYNKPCDETTTFGTVQREVLLEF